MSHLAITQELLAKAKELLEPGAQQKMSDKEIKDFQRATQALGFKIDVDKNRAIIGPQTRRVANALLLAENIEKEFGIGLSGLRPDLLEAMVNHKKIENLASDHLRALKEYNTAAEENLKIDLAISTNQVFQESGFNPKALNEFKQEPEKNSYGMYQFKLKTAREFGLKNVEDLNDPEKARVAYIQYTSESLRRNNNDQILQLVRYNAGQGAINYVAKQLGKDNITGLEWVQFMRERALERAQRDYNKGLDPKDYPPVMGHDGKMHRQDLAWDQITLQYVEKNVPDLDERLEAAGKEPVEKPAPAVAPQKTKTETPEGKVIKAQEYDFKIRVPKSGNGLMANNHRELKKALKENPDYVRYAIAQALQNIPSGVNKEKFWQNIERMAGDGTPKQIISAMAFDMHKSEENLPQYLVKSAPPKTKNIRSISVKNNRLRIGGGNIEKAGPEEIKQHLEYAFANLPEGTDTEKLKKNIQALAGNNTVRETTHSAALLTLEEKEIPPDTFIVKNKPPVKPKFDVFVRDNNLKIRGNIIGADPQEIQEQTIAALEKLPPGTDIETLKTNIEKGLNTGNPDRKIMFLAGLDALNNGDVTPEIMIAGVTDDPYKIMVNPKTGAITTKGKNWENNARHDLENNREKILAALNAAIEEADKQSPDSQKLFVKIMENAEKFDGDLDPVNYTTNQKIAALADQTPVILASLPQQGSLTQGPESEPMIATNPKGFEDEGWTAPENLPKEYPKPDFASLPTADGARPVAGLQPKQTTEEVENTPPLDRTAALNKPSERLDTNFNLTFDDSRPDFSKQEGSKQKISDNFRQTAGIPAIEMPDPEDPVQPTIREEEESRPSENLAKQFTEKTANPKETNPVTKETNPITLEEEHVELERIAEPVRRDPTPKNKPYVPPPKESAPVKAEEPPREIVDNHELNFYRHYEYEGEPMPFMLLHYRQSWETREEAGQRLMNDPNIHEEILTTLRDYPLIDDETLWPYDYFYKPLEENLIKSIDINAAQGDLMNVALYWVALEKSAELSWKERTRFIGDETPEIKEQAVREIMAAHLDDMNKSVLQMLAKVGVAVPGKGKTGLAAKLEKAKDNTGKKSLEDQAKEKELAPGDERLDASINKPDKPIIV